MVKATNQATEFIKSVMAEKNLTGAVRVFAQQGCGGSQLVIGVDEQRDGDASYEHDGVTFVIEQELSDQVGQVQLDYLSDAAQPGFSIRSERPLPVAEGCGCGCSC